MTDRTLWHGRFERAPAEELLAYTASLPFDRRLWRQDVRGSQAHVRGLGRAGLLSEEEVQAVLGALEQVTAELGEDRFAFVPTDEDIHTAVERRVTELAGAAGARLHTGRSRNDQVATDLRLWCKDELPAVAARIITLQQVLLDRADRSRRDVPAGLHAPATGATRAAGPSPAGPRVGAGP